MKPISYEEELNHFVQTWWSEIHNNEYKGNNTTIVTWFRAVSNLALTNLLSSLQVQMEFY